MARVILKPREERRVAAGHLWVFSNEIAGVEELAENGDLVDVVTSRGKFLGKGYYNRRSLIAARILSFQDQPIDADFFKKRLEQCLSYRRQFHPQEQSYRVVYSEGDYLPGLIVDKYGPYLAVQVLTLGMERLSDMILGVLKDMLQPGGIILRNDTSYREREGLSREIKVALGEIPDKIEIEESGLHYAVDLWHGQKTGFYFDQRENRRATRNLAVGRKVLDCFSYTGGFSMNACVGGATSVLAIDESAEAIELLEENAARNGFAEKLTTDRANCFDKLRELHSSRQRFDLIILDPPAFVKSKEKLNEALSGYREINLSAMRLLPKDGILLTCSCSYQLSPEDFLKMLRRAARDSKRRFKLMSISYQAPDHPVLLAMPETLYLKCAILRVID